VMVISSRLHVCTLVLRGSTVSNQIDLGCLILLLLIAGLFIQFE